MKNLTRTLLACSLLVACSHVSYATGDGSRGSTKTDHSFNQIPALELNVVFTASDFSDVYVFGIANTVPEVNTSKVFHSGFTAILANPLEAPYDHGIYLSLKESCYRSPHVDLSYRWKVEHFTNC